MASNLTVATGFAMVWLAARPSPVRVQALSQAALNQITDTANKICTTVPIQQTNQTVVLTGQEASQATLDSRVGALLAALAQPFIAGEEGA
jgi:hypothetical protein